MKLTPNYGYSSIELPSSLVFTDFNPECENQNKDGSHGFYNILKEINKRRENQGLHALFSLKPRIGENLPVDGFHPTVKTTENHDADGNQCDDTPKNVHDYIEKVRSAGHDGVTEIALRDHFSDELIDKLSSDSRLFKIPETNFYRWGDSVV